MSQLLDALRGNRERAHDPIPPVASPSGSLVISSLGLPASPRRRIPSTWIVVACSLAGALAGGSLTWRPAQFDRAVALQEAGDFDRAVEIYDALLARDEMPAQAHNNLGLIHQQRGQLDEAARGFENALAHDPRYAKAHNNLGLLLLARNRPDEAAERFSTAAALDGRDAGPLVNLALAHKAAGRLDQAGEALHAALAVSPGSAPAHYNLAVLFDRSGERARAAEHYRAFLEHRGSDHAWLTSDVRARLAALDAAR